MVLAVSQSTTGVNSWGIPAYPSVTLDIVKVSGMLD